MFGEVIREFRQQSGLSQEELAARAGLHRTYVSLIERGLRNPTLTVINSLADALGVTGSALLARLEVRRGEKP